MSTTDRVEALQRIAELVDEMDEYTLLCTTVHTRLAVVNDKLLEMEEKETLPPDDVVQDYESLVTDYQALLEKHANQRWIYRVVDFGRLIDSIKGYHERIGAVMATIHLNHNDAADARAEQERMIASALERLTADATIAEAVESPEEQTEALDVLAHEQNKANDGRVTSAVNRRLLSTALIKVIRLSNVPVRDAPAWFCHQRDFDYETESFAGGSFGAVHNGSMDGKDVVVKYLLMDIRTNAVATQQFRDEVTRWFDFRHPHVLQMYSACDVSPTQLIVCELAENGSLFRFLSHDSNKPHMFRLLHEAAQGLAYLHSKGVVHGDIKGDNILVSADNHAKIADFSFNYVCTLSESGCSLQSAVAGDDCACKRADSIRWRAPECLRDHGLTFASDVYSFGMCILEIVSEAAPWGHHVATETEAPSDQTKRASGVTDRVWDLVGRMCSFDANKRPSLESVISELEEMATRAELMSSSTKAEVVSVPAKVDSVQVKADFVPAKVDSMPAKVDSVSVEAGSSSESMLEQAIFVDDAVFVINMLSSATSIDEVVEGWDVPALVVAAATGAAKVIKMLLARGADPGVLVASTCPRLKQLDDTEVTALHVAAQAGHVSVVKTLLTAMPDLAGVLTAKQRTALHFAVQFGHVAVIQALLPYGAGIDEPDDDGWTPLHCSAIHGQAESARALLEHKADVHVKSRFDGTTALHEAAVKGHAALIEMLLRAGALIEEPDDDGRTPLYLSATNGQVECVRALIERGANIHVKSSNGKTVLHEAVAKGRAAVIDELLRAGALIDEPAEDGCTPLHLSARSGQLESVRVLLQHKADVHAKSKTGQTALHEAATNGHAAVIEELLSAGANIDETKCYSETALYLSVRAGHIDTVRVLLKYNINVHTKDSLGTSALHEAADRGFVAIVENLLSAGARIDQPGRGGRTPLHEATKNNRVDCVRVLLERKGDGNVSAKCDAGNTALHDAAAAGCTEIVKLLLAAGAEITRAEVKVAKAGGHMEIVKMLAPSSPSRLRGFYEPS